MLECIRTHSPALCAQDGAALDPAPGPCAFIQRRADPCAYLDALTGILYAGQAGRKLVCACLFAVPVEELPALEAVFGLQTSFVCLLKSPFSFLPHARHLRGSDLPIFL